MRFTGVKRKIVKISHIPFNCIEMIKLKIMRNENKLREK